MENVSVIPAIRKDRFTAGKVNIIIRVMIKRKVVKTISTGIKVHPNGWDEKERLVLKSEPNAGLYNAKIKTEVSRLEADFLSSGLMGVPLTKARVKRIAEGSELGRNFFDFCKKWLPEKYINKGTLRGNISNVNKIREFRKDLCFGDIDLKLLTDLRRYLFDKGLAPNTVWKIFKFLNTMVLDAIKMRIIKENPFDDFDRPRYFNPDKLGVSIGECGDIMKIIQDPLVEEKEKWVAAKFLLMCYSGLRFGDAMTYDPAIHSINGTRLRMKTQKAGVQVNMKFYNKLSEIVDILKALPTFKMTNHEYNRWLKRLGDYTIPLTAHVGRHTFGELLADMEIPLEQAQRLMGHKKIESTKVYYKIQDKALDRAMDKLNSI